jgi:putative transposase
MPCPLIQDTSLRFARVVLPGCAHHVLARGNRKADVFADDSDRLVYLRLLQQARDSSKTSIWAYVLMNNHVHIVAVPHSEDSLAQMVKKCHEAYSKYFNTKYGFVGHAWQNRFKSFVMEWTYCLNAVRYVERNPVRARLVNKAEHYLWSSAAAHCGLHGDVLLSDDGPLKQEIANWMEWLDVENPADVETTIRRHTEAGRPLGSNSFLAKAELETGRKLLPQKRGPRHPPEAHDHESTIPDLFG